MPSASSTSPSSNTRYVDRFKALRLLLFVLRNSMVASLGKYTEKKEEIVEEVKEPEKNVKNEKNDVIKINNISAML